MSEELINQAIKTGNDALVQKVFETAVVREIGGLIISGFLALSLIGILALVAYSLCKATKEN